MTFTLQTIHTCAATGLRYIAALHPFLPCTLSTLHQHARILCPELAAFCDANRQSLVGSDKGSAGKLVEFFVFGKKPNSDANPDLVLADVKATHVKKIGDAYNAKERLTLTNVGSTDNYESLQHIVDSETLETCKAYPKVQKGVMAVLVRDKSRPSMEEILQEQVVALFYYDLAALSAETRATIAGDYAKIRTCVADKAVTQAGQQYLHIHPHGSKGSKTRALGFTNKFVTWLICHGTGRELVKQGRSWVFRI
jgi:hypothetical protein